MNRLGGPGQRPAAVTVAIFAAVSLLLTPAGQAGDPTVRQPTPQFVGSVALGGALFWDGALFVDRAVGAAAPVFFERGLLGSDRATDKCAPPNDPITPCWAYQFNVTEKADTLRVAIDLNSREDCFLLEIFPPGTYEKDARPPPNDTTDPGADTDLVHCPEILQIAQTWNREAFIPDPAVGTWTVRLMPHRVDNLGFRFRAALENEEQLGDSTKGLLPNLQPYPPYEFGFVAPLNPAAGVAFDHLNPPGPPGISCTADERAEAAERGAEPPTRCLRFSFGLYNLGPGLFDLLLVGGGLRGPAIQRIHAEDGTVVKQIPVGEWEFHAAHGHKHYIGPEGASPWTTLELYRVLDSSKGSLEFVSTGAKTGMGPGDQRFLDWQRVKQGRWLESCNPGNEECRGLTNGWGDHYRWQRPGNYVPFPATNADGDYVVRLVIDPAGALVETGRPNNAAYAWIRVTGDQVTICERGLGLSPWDRHKRVHEPSFWLDNGGTTADSATGKCP